MFGVLLALIENDQFYKVIEGEPYNITSCSNSTYNETDYTNITYDNSTCNETETITPIIKERYE
jgi:hypothetical protein